MRITSKFAKRNLKEARMFEITAGENKIAWELKKKQGKPILFIINAKAGEIVENRHSDTMGTESESKTETMVGGLTVVQNSSSSISKASSMNSRRSFTIHQDAILDVPQEKRLSYFPKSLSFMCTKKSGTKNSLLDKIEIEESEKENDIDNEDEDIDQTIKINKQQTEVKPSNYALSTECSIKDCLNLIEGKINYVK